MPIRRLFLVFAILRLALPSETAAVSPRESLGGEPLKPIPLRTKFDRAKARLGEKLFYDSRISNDMSVSCASCHYFEHGGADYWAKSTGVAGKIGGINAPSIFNLDFNFRYNWNGAAETLVEHLELPMHNPAVMGVEFAVILERLKSAGDYTAEFDAAFPDGLTIENFKAALVEYERSLTTPNSRFDKWLRGDRAALSEEELAGYKLFKSLGCTSCHQGVNVGGNLFEKFGVMGDYFADRGNITKADFGRFNVTNQERDRFVFRVPSLRNVAMSAPYFHDGSALTLPDAVRVMARYQLGRIVTEEEVARITAFLATLTGDLTRP